MREKSILLRQGSNSAFLQKLFLIQQNSVEVLDIISSAESFISVVRFAFLC